MNEDQTPLPPSTTMQQDMVSASQRRINLIWERTQATIAIAVVVCTMGVGSYVAIVGLPESRIPTILSVAFGMITGFYFSRTNHAATGGVGPKESKPEGTYSGR